MRYDLLTKKEMTKMLSKTQINDKSSVPVFAEFRYLSPIDLSEEGSEYNTKYIVAYRSDEIIGVLKYKRYARRTHQTVLEKDKHKTKNYIAIRFVDVKEPFKRQGVATNLITRLSKEVGPNDHLVLSPLTKEGKTAKLLDIARAKIQSNVYSYNQYFG